MQVINDVHQQFAEYFPSDTLKPYLYLLSKKLGEGHICVDINHIDKEELIEAGYNPVINKNILRQEGLVSDGTGMKPFVLFNDRLYLQRYFNYETTILNRIKALIESEPAQVQEKLIALKEIAGLINGLFDDNRDEPGGKEEYVNWPLVAAVSAVLNNFTVITGGPGTGKTTTVAKLLSILYTINPALKVALTAPTGKAAARMGESLKFAAKDAAGSLKSKFEALEPSTIHRLLGTIMGASYFKHNNANTLNYDVVIADESSMIDTALFAKLLAAIGPATKLILLGDKDQLASVEAGSLFGDLCLAQEKLNLFSAARRELINAFIQDPARQVGNDHIDNEPAHPLFEHIIELQKSHRFSDNKGIGKFSKAIIHSREDEITGFFSNTDEEVTIDQEYAEKLFEVFISGYEAFINETDIKKALEAINNLRVLCAVREGEQGVYAINKKVEKYLQQKNKISITGDFYEHRPIMVTSNNYELGLFNGDIGIVRMDRESKTLKVWFETTDGKVKSVLPGYISGAETVYAMTIHKSQGSEFTQVLVILPKGEDIPILTRELLYTAITRAKKKVLVQGSETLILQTSKASVQRGSGIIDRFKQA
ncbi:MAG: exodeoxyribonuclease V subunit alpha [Ferruginibacter sp.]|nr:exodeoxyribonuclease V subunit alpha [Ferruginibacter sp.]